MPLSPINDTALDQIFRDARTQNGWKDEPVSDDTLKAIYDLYKFGPTSANCSPMRVLFLRTQEAKEKLKPLMMEGNQAKTMAAPVVAILGFDTLFYEKLPELFPHDQTAKSWFEGEEKTGNVTAFRNGTLQGAYFMIAARALGLDCGPMSGFDNDAVDAEFFGNGKIKSNFICAIGHGDPSALFDRSPRLPFDKVIWLVGVAMALVAYDHTLYGLALPQIQAELHISDEQVGSFLATIRLGALGALPLAFLADRHGRRVLLMITVSMSAIFTLLTGFAQTPEQFLVAQLLVKSFAWAEEFLAIVVVAETVNERVRGWAVGALAAMAGLGNGLAAFLYGFVDVLPEGWRALYVIGAVPLFFVAWLRRKLPETERYLKLKAERAKEPQKGWRDFVRPFVALVTAYPERIVYLALAVVPFGIAITSAILFMSKHLQSEVGMDPGDVSTLYLVGGAVAVFGNFIAGRVSDQLGRRRVLAVAVLFSGGAFAVLYGLAPGMDENLVYPVAVIGWILGIFGYFAAEVIFNAFGSEIFPTSYRSTSSTVRGTLYVLAGALGLMLQSVIYSWTGSHAEAVLWLLTLCVPAAIIVMVGLPEPAARALEDVAPEVKETA
ncbi:unnamed protein product [Symbiodinium microadriaticum]|nr:unnamed protein product [Symbiodinium microadriaticum]